jgi:hypothetical protein
MNMFSLCNVNITALCSVATTSYFLRRLRFFNRLRYPLDSSTYHLITFLPSLGLETPPVVELAATAARPQRRRRTILNKGATA